jgi:hypothetical protein
MIEGVTFFDSLSSYRHLSSLKFSTVVSCLPALPQALLRVRMAGQVNHFATMPVQPSGGR